MTNTTPLLPPQFFFLKPKTMKKTMADKPSSWDQHHHTAPLTTLSPGKEQNWLWTPPHMTFFSTQSHALFFSEVQISDFCPSAGMGVQNNDLDRNILLQAPPLMSLAEARTVSHYQYHWCSLCRLKNSGDQKLLLCNKVNKGTSSSGGC